MKLRPLKITITAQAKALCLDSGCATRTELGQVFAQSKCGLGEDATALSSCFLGYLRHSQLSQYFLRSRATSLTPSRRSLCCNSASVEEHSGRGSITLPSLFGFTTSWGKDGVVNDVVLPMVNGKATLSPTSSLRALLSLQPRTWSSPLTMSAISVSTAYAAVITKPLQTGIPRALTNMFVSSSSDHALLHHLPKSSVSKS